MTQQQIIGIAVLVLATVHSVTNAFSPTHSKIARGVITVQQRRPLLSRRVYSNNNIDDTNKKERFVSPEPIDPTSSSSTPPPADNIEFLFNDESANLNDITLPPVGFNSTTAQAIFSENAAVLSAAGDDTIDIGFDIDTDAGSTDDTLINEDLKAVLAASEEAAAAAEASMPSELVEVLDELAIVALNVTTNIDGTDIMPPEVVPTITTISPPILPLEQQRQQPKASVLPTVEELSETTPAFQQITEDSQSAVATTKSSNDSDTKTAISTPSVGKILRFAIPAIGVWLCGPLLSLIDTSAVGVLSGTIQQAALNPAVAVTDYAALLIAFLYTGTTNVVASAQESDRETSDKPRTAKMMIGAMQMSTFVGAGLGAIIFAFARPLLTAIIGNDAISPAVFAAAMKYVRIRALGMPAAAILGSTQAACLGMQDIRSPLYVLAAAAVINLLGDMLFVGHSNPLIGGTAGAAWATVISQYAAVAFFVRWLCSKATEKSTKKPPQVVNLSNAILEMTSKSDVEDGNGENRRQRFRNAMESLKLNSRRRNNMREQSKAKVSAQNQNRPGKKTGTSLLGKVFRRTKNANASTVSSSSTPSNSDSFSTRGFLNNRFSSRDFLKLPSKETRKEFMPYVIPVTTTQVGRVSGYIAMAHVVASSLGTVSMAAQQVIVSIFYCLCPIADSLSLTAQSFVPAISEKEPSMEKAAAMKKLTINFLKAGAVFGGAMMAGVSGIPLLTGFFTSDQAVIKLVNSVVPLLLVFFGIHGFVCGTEGILLGQKDLGYLGKMYAAFFAVVPYIMLKVKKKALAGSKVVGLTSVWTVFIGYQIARCGFWLARSAILQRRTNNEAKLAAATDMNMLTP